MFRGSDMRNGIGGVWSSSWQRMARLGGYEDWIQQRHMGSSVGLSMRDPGLHACRPARRDAPVQAADLLQRPSHGLCMEGDAWSLHGSA